MSSRSTSGPRSRGRPVLCQCSRCTADGSPGKTLPSQDALQHRQQDVRRGLQRERRSFAELDAGAGSSGQESGEGGEGRAGDRDRRRSRLEMLMDLDDEENRDDAPLDAVFGDDPRNDPGPDELDNADAVPPIWMRLFMILLLWLSCARGLPRNCADVLLAFIADIVPRDGGAIQARHITTVKKQTGFNPVSAQYSICPNEDCQVTKNVAIGPLLCDVCGTSLFIDDQRDKPHRYFRYQSLIDFLQQHFEDPAFEELINRWRLRPLTGKLEDITDGLAWRRDGFTTNRLHIYLGLGLDWFVAYSSSGTASYSVGVVSVRIENLPPHLRNRPENMHVPLILPGPKQLTDAGLASALSPLMEELRHLEDGVRMQLPGFAMPRMIRARVLLALGDVPARAKLAGFPSHSQAGEWCGHCHANSATWVDNLIRGEVHAARDAEDHRLSAFVVRSTPAARTNILQTKAATWTPLYLLPYWRSVFSVPVDAMHAVHLGACKRFYHTTLIEGGLLALDRGRYPIIAEVLASATFPRGLTAIRPSWGLRSAGSPTSNEWSTFARFLMPLVLASHWSAQLHEDASATFKTTNAKLRTGDQTAFVTNVRVRDILSMAIDLCQVVHLVQRRSLTNADVDTLQRVARDHIVGLATHIHKRWPVTNHHALMHLPEHIRQFGPPRAFWFYSQERLNGFLKKTVHNQHPRGELESTMQINLAVYRSVLRSMASLGDSPVETAFRKIMSTTSVALDSGGSEDAAAPGSVGPTVQRSLTTAFRGAGEPTFLDPATIHAIVNTVNSTRTAEDSVAIAEFNWDGLSPCILISAEAVQYCEISVAGVDVTGFQTRSNTAKGASFVIAALATGLRVARLVTAFQHVYAQDSTGELITRQYAIIDVFTAQDWPEDHVLGGAIPARLGHFLCIKTDPQRTVVPLVQLVDTCVTATGKYITGEEATMYAARLHP